MKKSTSVKNHCLYRVSRWLVSTGKVDFWIFDLRYMKFETIFRKMTMLTFQNHCQHVKKVILNIIFCMLKKISQKFFFIFYQLQQTPTWVVYKNSNHLPGFQIKHEKAATTYCEIFYSNHLLHLWFLAQKWFFFKHQTLYFSNCSNHLPN